MLMLVPMVKITVPLVPMEILVELVLLVILFLSGACVANTCDQIVKITVLLVLIELTCGTCTSGYTVSSGVCVANTCTND